MRGSFGPPVKGLRVVDQVVGASARAHSHGPKGSESGLLGSLVLNASARSSGSKSQELGPDTMRSDGVWETSDCRMLLAGRAGGFAGKCGVLYMHRLYSRMRVARLQRHDTCGGISKLFAAVRGLGAGCIHPHTLQGVRLHLMRLACAGSGAGRGCGEGSCRAASVQLGQKQRGQLWCNGHSWSRSESSKLAKVYTFKENTATHQAV